MVEKCRSSEVTFEFQAILHPKWGRLSCFHPFQENSFIIYVLFIYVLKYEKSDVKIFHLDAHNLFYKYNVVKFNLYAFEYKKCNYTWTLRQFF